MENTEKMVQFINPFEEDFTWTWNSVPHTFKSGRTVYIEEWKANHFAKHLVDRELLMNKKMINDQSRASLLKKCIVDEEAVEVPVEKMAMEIANKNKPKSKKTKKEEEPKEEVFEGLEA